MVPSRRAHLTLSLSNLVTRSSLKETPRSPKTGMCAAFFINHIERTRLPGIHRTTPTWYTIHPLSSWQAGTAAGERIAAAAELGRKPAVEGSKREAGSRAIEAG